MIRMRRCKFTKGGNGLPLTSLTPSYSYLPFIAFTSFVISVMCFHCHEFSSQPCFLYVQSNNQYCYLLILFFTISLSIYFPLVIFAQYCILQMNATLIHIGVQLSFQCSLRGLVMSLVTLYKIRKTSYTL